MNDRKGGTALKMFFGRLFQNRRRRNIENQVERLFDIVERRLIVPKLHR